MLFHNYLREELGRTFSDLWGNWIL